MTICSKMYEALDKRLEEKKTLDEIGSELCDSVIDPRGKAIRLIKARPGGEQYLKDNADWLGYNTDNLHGNDHVDAVGKKNLTQPNEQESIREDARSNGMRVDTPVYEQTPHKTIQSSQDEFEPEEIIYENDGEHPLQSCPIFYPKKEQLTLCPCGCGYGYCEIDEKWYTKEQIKEIKQ